MKAAPRLTLVFACALPIATPDTVTGQDIRVGANVRVTTGLEDRPLVEPHLATHPSDPRHLLGATIVSVKEGAFDVRQVCAAFLSLDGGASWQRHEFDVTGCGDPWVALTPEGHAVFTALGEHTALTQQKGGSLVVFHSTDGGRTWNPTPIGLGRGHDHQTIAVDATGGPRNGWLYVVSGQGMRADEGRLRWSVFVARSRDGGERFDEPFKIVPSNLNLNAELPAVLSDGTLVVSYTDFQRNVDEFRRGGRLDRSRTWLLRSTDGGHSFSVPLFVTEACGRGWTALAADVSAGQFRDNLYHTCIRRDSGEVVVHRSEDRGETWSDPTRVHAPPADSSARRHNSMIAVNRDGVVGVAWVDGRARRGCHEVWFTASLDGGKTFLAEQRVSQAISCPDPAGSGSAFNRWPTGGDYHGLAAAADGRFHVFWADSRTGVFQLWTAAVEVQRPHPASSPASRVPFAFPSSSRSLWRLR